MSEIFQSSPIINLAAHMDNRTSNEYLEVDPNTNGMAFVNLQNADLFNTKSLSTRLGVIDLGGGIINASGTTPLTVFNFTNASGVTVYDPIYMASQTDLRTGLIINGPSGDLLNGKLYIREVETSGSMSNPDIGRDLTMSMWIHGVQGITIPASGTGGFEVFFNSQAATNNIALSGFNYSYSVPAQLQIPMHTVLIPSDNKPIAISKPNIFNMGALNNVSGSFISAIKELDFQFYAPVPLASGSIYYLKPVFDFASGPSISGNTLGLQMQYIKNSGTDLAPNIVQATESTSSFPDINILLADYLVNSGINTPKLYLTAAASGASKENYMLVDYPDSNLVWSIPAKNGFQPNTVQSNLVWIPSVGNSPAPYNGLINSPPNGTTDSVEFGNLITVPSGQHTIGGSYFYMGVISGNGWSPFTVNKTSFDALGYNVDYVGEISSFTNAAIAGEAFNIKKGNILAVFSGNHTFNAPYTYTAPTNASILYDPTTGSAQTSIDKVYALFDNPFTINNSSGTQYLLTFKILNSITQGTNTDYITKTQQFQGGNYYNTFASPIVLGMNQYNNGQNDYFVYNQNGSGSSFIPQYNNNIPNYYQLSCGLTSFASGNGITSIYDFRIEDSASQRTIITQQNELLQAPLNDFQFTSIFSGAAIGNNNKWSHTTYQNQLISHQYAQISGVTWDMIYSGSNGTSMQPHGLQPNFTTTEIPSSSVPGAAGIPLGTTFQILLATQLGSGGIRASEIKTVTISGSSSCIRLDGYPFSGTDIYNPSGIPYVTTQYLFDPLPQSTYVFATQSSGNVFYVASLKDTIVGTIVPNPLANQGTWTGGLGGGVCIPDILASTLIEQVPEVIDKNQYYLTDQIPVPPFKKVMVFKDYVVGLGDNANPSRIWYSEQFTSNIFGTDGQYDGFVDIDLGNGSPITAAEVWKDYLYVFKYNSTYRLSYTGLPEAPFQITKISSTIGALGFFGTQSTDYGIFGLSQFGVFLANYSGVETISDEIIPFYSNLDHTDLTFAVAIFDRLRQQIYWSISSQNASPFRNYGLCYSLPEKAWNIRQNGMWLSAGIIGDDDNFNQLYIGTSAGQLQEISAGDSDSDDVFVDIAGKFQINNISLEAETPWLNFGNSENLKRLRNLRFNCATSNQQLKIDVYYDQNTDIIQYTRYLNMNGPVISRVVSLGGRPCRTVKFIITSVGTPDVVQLNSMQVTYANFGPSTPI